VLGGLVVFVPCGQQLWKEGKKKQGLSGKLKRIIKFKLYRVVIPFQKGKQHRINLERNVQIQARSGLHARRQKRWWWEKKT